MTTCCTTADEPTSCGRSRPRSRWRSSHSWVRYLATGRPYRRATREPVSRGRRTGRLRAAATRPAAGPDVVLEGVDAGDDVVGQPEPEGRGRIDLGGVGPQRLGADVVEPVDVDAGGDAVVLRLAVEPLVVERRLQPVLEEGLVGRLHAAPGPDGVVHLGHLPRLAELRVAVGVGRGVDRSHRDLVDPQVVRVRVPGLVVAVGQDDLRSLASDDLHQPPDRLVERGPGEAAGIGVVLAVGHPESR